MFSKFLKFLIITGIGLAVLPDISFAQANINLPYSLSNELIVNLIPTYPRPDETTFVSLELYTDDLDSADIEWYKNGELDSNGKGQIKYSFKTGHIGEETNIEIRIRLLSGATFSKSFTLAPASVDLTWEANSYVPPFYKGRALHARQGVLKIVAMPEFVKNGARIAPQNLIYKWSNDVETYQSQSGYGKNILILNGSLLGKTENIRVLVTDPVNNLVAQDFIDIAPTDPEIVFYKIDPYYGHIFDTALTGTFYLKGEEVQILAVPFYFSKEKDGLLQYVWMLNGLEAPSLSGSRTAIFRKPEDKTGRSSVSLRVENQNRILQQADGGFVVNFSK